LADQIQGDSMDSAGLGDQADRAGGIGPPRGPDDPGNGPHPEAGQPYAQPGQPYGSGGPYGPPPFGQPAGYGPGWNQPRGTNSLAIAALWCGIGQIVAWVLTGIPAIILGYLALGQIRRTGEDGRGLAIAGIILGWVGLALLMLVVVLVIAVAGHSRS
jgi:hypothetical protein